MKTFVQLIEDIKSADKKPEVYTDASGKQKYRMVSKNKAMMKEKTLTPAEKKKREEIATAMERENPGMDMSKKMAIATAAAKRVAEEVELDEAAYMSGSSADRAEAHHDQAQKHFDAAENAHSTSEASAHRYAARAHVKAGMSHEKRAENPASKTATAVAAVSSHAHKLTQMAGRIDESVELEQLDERYETKRADKKMIGDKEHTVHALHHNGEEIGRIYPHSAISQTKPKGSRVATSQKTVVRWGYQFYKDKGPVSRYPTTGMRDKNHAAEEAIRAHSRWKETNESTQLDELSAVTLGNYSQKARTDALDHSGGPWGKKKDPARVAKRLKGDAMAVKKLDKIRGAINKK
jgi:hypothetical protein